MLQIGPYQVNEFLDSGTYGNLYRCVKTSTGEVFNCKIIETKHIMNSQYLDSFVNELQVHSQLEHPSITRLVDVQLDDSYIYLILENNSGGNLEQLLQLSGSLPEEKAAMIFKQVMEGITYIHSLGIAHRDVTLKNIILTSEGYAKLSDFGLSKHQTDNGYLSTTCGTFVYVPPEILMQQKYDGFKADIWSAGICLYAMTSNHLPWVVNDKIPPEKVWEETQRQICTGDFYYDESVQSDLLRDLLQQMLCVDPEYRIEAEEVLCHPWMTVAEEYTPPTCHSQEPTVIPTVNNLIKMLKA